jgi:hypothetical protein
VGLGQRGEAREVGEQERLRCQLGSLCHSAPDLRQTIRAMG